MGLVRDIRASGSAASALRKDFPHQRQRYSRRWVKAALLPRMTRPLLKISVTCVNQSSLRGLQCPHAFHRIEIARASGAGLLELAKLETYCNIRQELAALAQQRLGEIPGIRFPVIRPGDVCGYKDFTIIIDEDFPMTRDMLAQVFSACGVQSRKYFLRSTRPLPMNISLFTFL